MSDYAGVIARRITDELGDYPDTWGDLRELLAEAARAGYELRDGVGK